MQKKFDLIVIGAGPGGYVAAIRAAQLGLNVAIIEKQHLGGICLNWGCIPTKSLLRSSEVYHLIKEAANLGINVKDVSIDFSKIIARSREVSTKLSHGIKHLLQKNKISVFNGHASITPSKTVSIKQDDGSTEELSAPHTIIATGARPRILGGIEPDGKLIWTYKEAMIPDSLPSSIAIMGSGAIGIEFASFYNLLGVDVTIIELSDRILTQEDREISALACQIFTERGIKILTNTTVKSVKKHKDSIDIICETSGEPVIVNVQRLISAVGVVPNTEKIGLEHTQVVLEQGYIKTDSYMKTAEDGIYAIGDVAAPPWLAHKATHEAITCVEKIAGLKNVHTIKPERIPKCVYCFPQIASIGLTEMQAKNNGHTLKIGRFPLSANGKALAIGDSYGFIKVIFSAETGEFLGAHMLGPETTEIIQGLAILMNMEGTELDLMHTIFPHPSLSEAIHEATLNAYGRGIHI